MLVADDHPLFREGIERAVREQPDLELVGTAVDGRQALELIRELVPQVAALDLRLPALNGLQVLNAVARDDMPTRALLLSASGDPETVYRALQSGPRATTAKRPIATRSSGRSPRSRVAER